MDHVRQQPDLGHHFWVISDPSQIKEVLEIFDNEIPFTYVADGHHRTAAAALVGNEKRQNNPNHDGDEEYNFFLAVHFPASQLTIIDYNRVIKDLNGHAKEELIDLLKDNFDVKLVGKEEFKPSKLHEFGMYLDGEWYALSAFKATYDDSDPIGVLDVTILSEQILKPISWSSLLYCSLTNKDVTVSARICNE